jgi:uncharacterized membrane protein
MMRIIGLLRGVENLFLGLWVGGLVFLAAFTAPVVFKAFASRAQAGAVMAVIIEKFARMEYLLALVLFFVAIVLLLITEKNRVRTFITIAVVLMFLFATLYSRVWQPQMRYLRSQITTFDLPSEQDFSSARKEFEKLHRRYTALVTVNLLLGVSVLILKGFDPAARRRKNTENRIQDTGK